MGLFDKLKDVVNTAGDSINKAMEKAINTIDSNILSQEEQWYYDMILNMLLCVKHLQKEHIKVFIEKKANKVCDEATLDKVLEKFETEEDSKTNAVWYRLTSTQSSRAYYKNGRASWFKKEEFDFIFDGFAEEIISKFASVYEVVRENPTKDILEQGISKITGKLSTDKPDRYDFSYAQKAVEIIGKEIHRRFMIGDGFLSQCFIDEVIRSLQYIFEHRRDGYTYIDKLYAFALHAMHYEKADKAAENYNTLTKEECLAAVKASEVYQNEIKKKPFDKEEIIDSAVSRISECCVLFASKGTWESAAIDDKLTDAVCFQAWQEIVDAVGESADNVEDAVDIIHTYISNASDGEYEESEGHTSYNYNMLSDEQREGLGVVDLD